VDEAGRGEPCVPYDEKTAKRAKTTVMSRLVRLIASQVERTIWSFSDSSTRFLYVIFICLVQKFVFAYQEGTSILPAGSFAVCGCVSRSPFCIPVVHGMCEKSRNIRRSFIIKC
jgi:hypothetical protein